MDCIHSSSSTPGRQTSLTLSSLFTTEKLPSRTIQARCGAKLHRSKSEGTRYGFLSACLSYNRKQGLRLQVLEHHVYIPKTRRLQEFWHVSTESAILKTYAPFPSNPRPVTLEIMDSVTFPCSHLTCAAASTRLCESIWHHASLGEVLCCITYTAQTCFHFRWVNNFLHTLVFT